jgi:hypothetical protein
LETLPPIVSYVELEMVAQKHVEQEAVILDVSETGF